MVGNSLWRVACPNPFVHANWLLLAIALPALTVRADVCNPSLLVGTYAFQLSGMTTISATPKPTASLGVITLDGNGGITGTASATFAGFLLGNPVTGSYAANWDCSIAWQLQDDAGAFQHFRGTYSPDGNRVQFKQADPGGAPQGIMVKTPGACSPATLAKKYHYTISGNTTPMKPGDLPHSVSRQGTLDTVKGGSFQVASDCSVLFQLSLPSLALEGAPPLPMNMRGFLVNDGREILAFQTDPGAMVAARLTALR